LTAFERLRRLRPLADYAGERGVRLGIESLNRFVTSFLNTAALHEIGYDGAVVIESFTPDNQTIARAAAIWRPLAATQEALARDGLAFLRGQFH